MGLRVRLASFLSEVLANVQPPYCPVVKRRMLCRLCPNHETISSCHQKQKLAASHLSLGTPKMQSYVDKTLSVLFHPVLWSLPFLFLALLNVYQIVKVGPLDARLPFVQYKPYSSLNVLMFSLLALWSLHSFSRFKRPMRVYLTFCILFACYGTGEIIWAVLWAPQTIGQYGLFTWVLTRVYPLFFFFNNLPVYLHLEAHFSQNWKRFASLLVLQLAFYVGIRVLEAVTYPGNPDSLPLYYSGRASAVLAYAAIASKHGEDRSQT